MNPEFICPVTQSVMTDPVSAPCGHTFDRSTLVNIDEYRSTHGLWKCPVCRAAWPSNFTPNAPSNFALKALIDYVVKATSFTSSLTPAPTSSVTSDASPPPPPPPPIQVTMNRIKGSNEILISLNVDEAPDATMRTLFIDCLDTSGSMDSSSVDTTQKESDAAIFSRADLVKHSIATQIELLRSDDELAIIKFSDNADVLLDPTPMNTAGRTKARDCLTKLRSSGGTNIWAGLHKAYSIASRPEHANKNIVIIFQTDGEPTPEYVPPKGIVDTFRNWLSDRRDLKVTLHTVGYGFGTALDMPLLRSLAEIGKGTVNYVPDGSMIGTVFIHLMANLMSCLYRGVRISIPDLAITIPVGYIQGGQSRDILIETSESFREVTVLSDNDPSHTASPTHIGSIDADAAGFHRARHYLIDKLTSSLHAAERDPASTNEGFLDSLVTFCQSHASTDPRVASLLIDLKDADPNKGQLGKAFASPSAFKRWGRHYAPSVLSGHKQQWPINFKDEGSKIYGPARGFTRTLIDRGDEIFNSLPPPTASCDPIQSSGVYGYNTPPSTAPRLSSMMTVNSPIGPCFLGASRVKMADGTEKRCDQIRPGDIDAAGYVIAKVIKTLVPYADIVRLENVNLRPIGHAPLHESGGFTLWHPVHHGGSWVHPATVGPVVRVQTDAIYNFVLEWDDSREFVDPYRSERPGVLIINGLMTCTMGHSMTGPVIGHPYFGAREPGKRNIIDDLRATRGWASGTIVWKNAQVIHDPATGFICGMTAEEDAQGVYDMPGYNSTTVET